MFIVPLKLRECNPETLSQNYTEQRGGGYLDAVGGDKWNYAGRKSGGNGGLGLENIPCRARSVADSNTEYHRKRIDEFFILELADEQRNYNGAGNIADYVAACNADQLLKSTRKARENRQTEGAEQNIEADGSDGYLEISDGGNKHHRKGRKGYRNRPRRERNGGKNADESRQNGAKCHFLDFHSPDFL